MLNEDIQDALALRRLIDWQEHNGVHTITDEQLQTLKTHLWKPSVLNQMDIWSRQYLTRGHIWGDEPSICAKHLVEKIPGLNRVLELGCGYGRDAKFFVDNGFLYKGLDNSDIAVFETVQQLKKSKNFNGTQKACFENIVTADLTPDYYDAVTAHRVFHLPHPDELPPILNRVSGTLRANGRIAFTMRHPDDFDPKDMKRLGDYTAEYKERRRKGHIVHFYDEERLHPLLSKHFTDLSYTRIQEPESFDKLDATGKPKNTKLIMVTGRKKTDLEMFQSLEQN